ncbi:aminotransferase class V-fold PLP-dependent enzyme [Psychromonas sp. 14N.309.X.WAT.B.A12]|uniref:aminotransferase class V-fold PLP-dependent enzyme n=2 Tax=Psychromonas TaxID=67572 RepID=UPI0025B13B90|nr:aminotransferase class V-fold PLP-dependent enzyme [Psychromonas sp. 14N.309.X.WAT.B.A12]MDN2664101.1 aminotransferase class V-fold PLP-dependent enzyme [Psychromonas sp. 14N.309.X.WAT.B.A12]
MKSNIEQGEFFSDSLLKEIKEKFYHVDIDPIQNKKRIFFDNSGGAFRLKSASNKFKQLDELPDCPEHGNKTATWLMDIQKEGYRSIKTMLNFDTGSIVTSYTASMVMFDMVRLVMENIPGGNVVTTMLEHPSAYDAMVFFAEQNGKELRVAKTNPLTGGVDVEEITRLIDEDTCLLTFMYASNVSGALLDEQKIVEQARKIKPDLYIVADAVQHAPHGVIDVTKVPVDGINFAPYKFFGPRGFGVGYVSERLSKIPHNKLIAKPQGCWQLGSPAPAHFAALTEVVNYVCWIGEKFNTSNNRRALFVEGMERIKLHERALMNAMLEGTENTEGLRHIAGAHVYLDYKDLTKKDFIMAIGFDNIEYKKAVDMYEELGIIAFERLLSSPYSSRMLESFDLKGAIRVSPIHCHNLQDIEEFLTATKAISNS